jgi:hypothetical protein
MQMIKLRSTGTVSISSGAIAASGTYTTDPMDCTGLQGFFSLQWTVVGTGTMKAEVLVSNDGSTFTEVDADICTAQATGTNISDFEVTPCNQMKIRFTELTGGGSTMNITARLRAF